MSLNDNAMKDSTEGLRVGFIGAGWTERVQIPTFRLGGLTAQAICANQPENAQRVAEKLEIPQVYNSWRELVHSADVDIVSIATPPHLHAEIAIAALRAGKHVICEKPTSLNVAEAENMFAAAQAAPNQLAIIDHELRFHPQRAHLRQLMREGYIGNTLYLELDWLYSHRLDPQLPWSWHSDIDRGGGSLGALGSHLIDLSRWISGRIDGLVAQLQTAHFLRPDPQVNGSRRVTSDDSANLLVQFGTGIQGRITVNALYPDNRGMSVLVVGTEGALKIDDQDQLWGLKSEDYPHGEWEPIAVGDETKELDLPNRSPFTIGSYYLAKALSDVLSKSQIIIPEAASFYDGLIVQRVLDAARRSHRERTWVRL